MATKYAIYELEKVKGKKEYIPSHVVSVEGSLTAAYRELERYWDDCLNHPVWFNKKIREHVAYDLDDKMLYNMMNYWHTNFLEASPMLRWRSLGIL